MDEDKSPCRALRSKKIMESGSEQRMRKGSGTLYRIVVREELGEMLASAFEGMEMETNAGQTILTGEVDHSHLHGILDRIGALGLKLVSVESLPHDVKVNSNLPLPNYTDKEVQQ